MIDTLMTIMSSSGVGAITGGIFGWLNRREDRKAQKDNQDFQIKMIGVQSTADIGASEARAFEESQKTLSKFGDAIKSAVRPLITGMLLYMVWGILQGLEDITGGLVSMDADTAAVLYRDITLNIISLTATAVSWWFASRPTSITKLRG